MAEACVNTSKLPIQCPVCLDTYQRPRTLPCLHSFCTSCLHGHITNAGQNLHFSSFLCPVCRSNTRPPRPYSGKDTWTEQFPINHWIVSVIDEASSINRDDAIYCDLHSESKVNLYCFDHESVCCAMCIATEHRKCDHVDEIANLLALSDYENERQEILEGIKYSEDVLTDLTAKCALAESNLQIDKDKMTNVIEKEHAAIIEHIDTLKQAALDNVDENCRPLSNEILTRKIICNKGKQTCRQVKEILSKKSENKTPFASFIQIKSAKLKMKEVDVSFANDWCFNEANTLTFQVERQNEEIKNVRSLGKVKDTREDQSSFVENINPFPKCMENQLASQESSEIRSLQNDSEDQISNVPEIVNEIPIAIGRSSELQYVMYWTNPLFKHNCVTGLTFPQHDLLMLCSQTEASLCLLKDKAILHEERRNRPPWDVSTLSETRVVVTYPQENLVRIFEIKYKGAVSKLFRIVGRPLSSCRKFSTTEACFGVVAAVGQIFLACEDCIKVYTVHGICVQILKFSNRNNVLFERVISLSYDQERSTLYAADEVGHSVFSFKIIGRQLNQRYDFMYKNPNLHCPRGLAVGLYGEIFVTGFVSKSVHVLNDKGECMKILSTEQSPFAVSVNRKQSLLVISYYPEAERRNYESSSDVRFYQIKGRFNTH